MTKYARGYDAKPYERKKVPRELLIRNTFLRHLDRPIYVIKMNFPQSRWGNMTRLRWLTALRDACLATAKDINDYLEQIDA